jgi:hypothetical protein
MKPSKMIKILASSLNLVSPIKPYMVCHNTHSAAITKFGFISNNTMQNLVKACEITSPIQPHNFKANVETTIKGPINA